MTISTKEVTEKIEGLFQSAESKLSDMKEGERKIQASASKKEALGHYFRTLRNEHVDAAFDIVSKVLQNKDIKNEAQLQAALKKIVVAATNNKELKVFRDAQTVEELKQRIEEDPEGAKTYFSARALDLLISESSTGGQAGASLASALNFTHEKDSESGFNQYVSTHSQFVFKEKKAPFLEEMKEILSKFSGDDAAKNALLSKLEGAVSDEAIDSPNAIQGIISEAMSDPNSPLSLFLYQNDSYSKALDNLNSKEIPQQSFSQSITSYIASLRSNVNVHIEDENKRISDRINSLGTLLEKAEKDAQSAATNEAEILLSRKEYQTKILRKLNIKGGKSDFIGAVVSYSGGGHSYFEKIEFDVQVANEAAQTKKFKQLFDWLNSADSGIQVKLIYDNGIALFWKENNRFYCSENTVQDLQVKPVTEGKSTQNTVFLAPEVKVSSPAQAATPQDFQSILSEAKRRSA